jgi:hypothetical protein
MDDLRTELQTYFETAVKPVDLDDIVYDTNLVISATQRSFEARRRGREKAVWLAVGVMVILVWGVLALTASAPPVEGEPAGPGTTTPPVADPLNLAYTVPPGWESSGDFRLQKSAKGPQGAEGIVYWVTYPESDYATNCAVGPEFATTRALDNLALGIAHTSGLNLVTGPDEAFVGGLAARYVQAEIVADEGCDPGYFYQWKGEFMGAIWMKYSIGMAVDVWVVDVGAGHLLIVGLTDPEFPVLRDEIREFVDSIEFRTG